MNTRDQQNLDRLDGVQGEGADEALQQIVSGFQRFRTEVFPEQEELFQKLANA
ncbi:MAG: carbonic anhydrase, partial [Pseudomonas sp.]